MLGRLTRRGKRRGAQRRGQAASAMQHASSNAGATHGQQPKDTVGLPQEATQRTARKHSWISQDATPLSRTAASGFDALAPASPASEKSGDELQPQFSAIVAKSDTATAAAPRLALVRMAPLYTEPHPKTSRPVDHAPMFGYPRHFAIASNTSLTIRLSRATSSARRSWSERPTAVGARAPERPRRKFARSISHRSEPFRSSIRWR